MQEEVTVEDVEEWILGAAALDLASVMVAVSQSVRTSRSSSSRCSSKKNKKYTMDLCKNCSLRTEEDRGNLSQQASKS